MTPPKSSNFARLSSVAVPIVVCLAVAGCGLPNGGRRAGLTAAQAQECRARSEEVYRQQNRADIYKSDTYATSTRDSPFSTSGLPGITSSGLGSQYGRERALNDCYNASASGSPATPQAPILSPTAP